MSRIQHWQYIVDEEGNPIEGANINFYLADTITPAEIFLHPTAGVTTTTTATPIQTDDNGFYNFYIGDEWEANGGYAAGQKFKVTWDKAGIATGQINNIDVFPAIFQVDETDNTSLERATKNKLISNELAYKWESHVDAQFGTNPHDILPVDKEDTNTDLNKLVSNSLLNYMFSILSTAGTISIDASGAVIRPFSVSSWTSSANEYYTNLDHFLGRLYPVVQIRDTDTKEMLYASKIKSLTTDTIQVWVGEDIDAEITVIG